MKLVLDILPNETNGRNSEGSFIRLDDGDILFAYSRYNTGGYEDAACCDIAAIRSHDEGESWSEPEIIAKAVDFGVENIMSVSALRQQDGRIGIYFLIKENDLDTTIGRAFSNDGKTFSIERCLINGPTEYYVINNDRFIRLADGRIAVPASYHNHDGKTVYRSATTVCMISEDDGHSFIVKEPRLNISALQNRDAGMQEAGMIQHKDGVIRVWGRTRHGFQYESYSRDYMETFTPPAPSVFTAPVSPLEMAENDGVIYAIYNPVPQDNLHGQTSAMIGRTPLVIRRSCDDGRTWGPMTVIESDKDRGYCYPAVFFTNDGAMLCAYCRGSAKGIDALRELGMMKIPLDEIK